MTIRVAINGYGRIGRNVLRAHYEGGKKHDIEIVAINDLGDPKTNAHLTKYDTAHGPFPGQVSVDGDSMVVDGDRIRVLANRNPAELPWGELNVDVVLECTGFFTSKEKASAHLKGGAKKVIISAPGGKDVDATIVYGVNHRVLKASDTVISNASCTTNCLAPLAKPLNDAIGIEQGLMTTIHAYTNDQVLTDVYHEDLRRARSATHSMIPTKTGAAAAVGLVLPELNGKLDGYAMRVPTINVSIVDLSFIAGRDTSVEEINAHPEGGQRGGRPQGHPGLQQRAAGQRRLQPQPGVVDLRRDAHQGVGPAGQGVELVRQRVGLLEPHARHHRRADVGEVGPARPPPRPVPRRRATPGAPPPRSPGRQGVAACGRSVSAPRRGRRHRAPAPLCLDSRTAAALPHAFRSAPMRARNVPPRPGRRRRAPPSSPPRPRRRRRPPTPCRRRTSSCASGPRRPTRWRSPRTRAATPRRQRSAAPSASARSAAARRRARPRRADRRTHAGGQRRRHCLRRSSPRGSPRRPTSSTPSSTAAAASAPPRPTTRSTGPARACPIRRRASGTCARRPPR